jgi:hypothetical protein
MALAHERFQVQAYPTPIATDVLFYEVRDNVLPKNKWPPYGQPHENVVKWPNHKLVFIQTRKEDGKQMWWFAADRENQDLYNFAFSDADIGGVKFKAVQRVYIIPRDEWDPDVPVMGTSMPNIPAELFGTGSGDPSVVSDYVLSERRQGETPEKEINSLYVLDVRTYIKRTSIREIGVDPLNGQSLFSWTNLYYATEVVTGSTTATALFAAPTNAYWGLQSDGTQRSGKQLSEQWFIIETAQVIGGVMVDGLLTIHSYTSNDNYYWPPVLDTYELLNWERLDGSFDYFPAIRFSPEGYNGPCLTTTTTTWSITPFSIPVVEQMQPTRIYYASPFFTLNIPECLHGAIAVRCDIGNTDAVYAENAGSARHFSATNFTTWPATITAFDDQQPFRGGFLRTRKVVTRPVPPAQINWVTGA